MMHLGRKLNYNNKEWKDKRLEAILNKYYYLVNGIIEEYLGYKESLVLCEEIFAALYVHHDLSLPDEELKNSLTRIAVTKCINYDRKRAQKQI